MPHCPASATAWGTSITVNCHFPPLRKKIGIRAVGRSQHRIFPRPETELFEIASHEAIISFGRVEFAHVANRFGPIRISPNLKALLFSSQLVNHPNQTTPCFVAGDRSVD